MNPHRIVLLGPPASGKGTQGWIMSERWGVSTVSVGEVLRAEIAAGTPLGQEAARHMEHGRLVPDSVAIASAAAWLESHGDTFVFDGFPRTVGQAVALGEVLDRLQTPLTAVLWLELPQALIEERVSRRVVCKECGRSFQIGLHVADREEACPVCGGGLKVRTDDNTAMLITRLEQYREHTQPVMDYYEKRELVRRIDAAGSPEEVFARIEAATATNTQMEAAGK